MPLFPKPRFRWIEPKVYLAAEQQRESANRKWWLKPALVLGGALFYFVMILPVQWLKRYTHAHDAEDMPGLGATLFLCLLLSAFLVYGVPWLCLVLPLEVKISDKGIVITRGGGLKFLKFQELRAYDWIPGPEYSVLVLTCVKIRPVRIGVPLTVSRDDVSTWLGSRGLRNEPPP